MAQYKVLAPSFINHRIYQPGEIVEQTFTPPGFAGDNLELVGAPDAPPAGAPKPLSPFEALVS